jgi:hypothetical protein
MLVRVIFSVVVTLGLLVAAAFWHSGERAVEPAMERAGEALEPVVERALELADETAERLEEAAPAVAPVVEEAARALVAAVEPPEPKPAREPTPAPAEPAAEEPEPVEEESLTQSWDDPFVEGPTEDDGDEGEILIAEVPGPAPSFYEGVPPDQDEWAGLIRRMLAIRSRVEAAR